MADGFYVPRAAGNRGIVILTGGTGSGKTTRAGEVVDVLRRRGFEVGGILATGLLAAVHRSGFDLVDLRTGQTTAWCRERQMDAHAEQRWGRFEFTTEGLQLGRAALAVGGPPADVMVLDEVGPLELAGGGWADCLDLLVENFGGPILLVARLAVVDAVRTRWGSASTPVYDVARVAPDAIADMLLERTTTAAR